MIGQQGNNKKVYCALTCTKVQMSAAQPVFIGSPIFRQQSTIMSVGQEIGEVYDFSKEGNTFNHEWELDPME